MQKFAFFSLLLLLVGIQTSQAQNYRPNFSIQVGTEARLFSPNSLNYVVDSLYNTVYRGVNPDMNQFRWTTGLWAGVTYTKGRANLRIHAATFGARQHGVHTDTTNTKIRTDIAFSGGYGGLTLTSELIPITDIFGFYVGAGFTLANIRTLTASVPNTSFNSSDPLTEASNQWNAGFLVQAPFRLWLGEYVQLSLEPYYQVHFSPFDFETLGNQVALGDAVRDRLRGEGDHVGVNFNVSVYFRAR